MRIKLTGRGPIIANVVDQEDTGDIAEFCLITDDVDVYKEVEDDEWKNITFRKGDFIETNTFIRDNEEYQADPDNPEFPRYYRLLKEHFDFEAIFDIDVDPEDFDPKKLHLYKSIGEFDFIKWGIPLDTIQYDGSNYGPDDDEEYYATNLDYPMSGYEIVKIDKMPMND